MRLYAFKVACAVHSKSVADSGIYCLSMVSNSLWYCVPSEEVRLSRISSADNCVPFNGTLVQTLQLQALASNFVGLNFGFLSYANNMRKSRLMQHNTSHQNISSSSIYLSSLG